MGICCSDINAGSDVNIDCKTSQPKIKVQTNVNVTNSQKQQAKQIAIPPVPLLDRLPPDLQSKNAHGKAQVVKVQ
jgi:hypothetical protein